MSGPNVTLQEEKESPLQEHEADNTETNDPQEEHFTSAEDTPNNIGPKAQPIAAGEPHLVAVVKCQPTSLISPSSHAT